MKNCNPSCDRLVYKHQKYTLYIKTYNYYWIIPTNLVSKIHVLYHILYVHTYFSIKLPFTVRNKKTLKNTCSRIILIPKYFNLIELRYFYRWYNCLFCFILSWYRIMKLSKSIFLAPCLAIYIERQHFNIFIIILFFFFYLL